MFPKWLNSFWEHCKLEFREIILIPGIHFYKIMSTKTFNFTVFRILRSWKFQFKNWPFLSFFRIVRSRRNRLCTLKNSVKKSLISLFFVFSEAEISNLKIDHFCAFFVFSETGENDFAQYILGSKNRLLEAGKWKNSHFWDSSQQ